MGKGGYGEGVKVGRQEEGGRNIRWERGGNGVQREHFGVRSIEYMTCISLIYPH